jgi:pimeloyl-ACP methyl ester carboxylesterase
MKAMATDLASHARQRLLAQLPVTERRLSLNGIETAVLEGGEGRPVVLLHGPGAYGAQWLQVIPELVKSYRVIAPDLPGHGASGFGPEATIPEHVNGWLDDLIECTCASAPVLVGHTLGGAIAARFAADQGKRARALILVDSLGLAQFQPAPAFGAALVAFLSKPDEQTHDGLWAQCVFDYARVQRRIGARWPLMREYNLIGAQRPGGIPAIGAWMQHIGSPAIPAQMLSRIRIPTSLIWGREDRATALAVAEQASARFGWPLHVIDDAADDPTLEQPEEFLRVLLRLLAAA